MNKAVLLLVCVTVLLGLGLGGCVVVHHDPATPTHRGYKPPVYKSHTVYFTSRGVPFFCQGNQRERLPDHKRSQYSTYYHNHQRSYEAWVRNHPAPCTGGQWHSVPHGQGRSHPRKSHRR
jgi:hypothetical protein